MLRAGLIGFPAVGKSTLFRLMTSAPGTPKGGRSKADASVGVAKVPEPRLGPLVAMFNPRKRVPATVEFLDVAPGGKTADLLDIAGYRNADALIHVIRMFRDEGVPSRFDTIDPVRDVRAMEDELILADLAVVERRIERLERDLKKTPSADLKAELQVLERCKSSLDSGVALRTIGLSGDDARRLRGFQLLSAKPLLLVINLDESDLPQMDRAIELSGLQFARPSSDREEATAGRGAGVGAVPVCAKIELEIAALNEADAQAFLTELGLKEPGVDRMIRASYGLLGYISFFTVGEDECRAWSIPRGTTAQVAAGEIHSDIARGFIRAEVVSYSHLITRGSLVACRDRGDMRLEGKEYIVQDGDVINFRFAT